MNSKKSNILIIALVLIFAATCCCVIVFDIFMRPVPAILAYPAVEEPEISSMKSEPLKKVIEIQGFDNGAMGQYHYAGNGVANIVCTTITTCLHEVGHHLDHLLWMPSLSQRWKNAVDYFIIQCRSGVDHFFCTIEHYNGVFDNPMGYFYPADGEDPFLYGGYSELYAHIYEYSITMGEEIPIDLQIYFTNDWNKGE